MNNMLAAGQPGGLMKWFCENQSHSMRLMFCLCHVNLDRSDEEKMPFVVENRLPVSFG